MLVDALAVVGAEALGEAAVVVGDGVEHALSLCLQRRQRGVVRAAHSIGGEQPREHLLRVVLGRNRFVVTRVGQPRPNADRQLADRQLQRFQRGGGANVLGDHLVDRDARGVAGAVAGGSQRRAGQAGAHAVGVGVAARMLQVAAVDHHQVVFVWLQRRQDGRELEIVARAAGPPFVENAAAAGEPNHEALGRRGLRQRRATER